jgi:hypothetical protein
LSLCYRTLVLVFLLSFVSVAFHSCNEIFGALLRKENFICFAFENCVILKLRDLKLRKSGRVYSSVQLFPISESTLLFFFKKKKGFKASLIFPSGKSSMQLKMGVKHW